MPWKQNYRDCHCRDDWNTWYTNNSTYAVVCANFSSLYHVLACKSFFSQLKFKGQMVILWFRVICSSFTKQLVLVRHHMPSSASYFLPPPIAFITKFQYGKHKHLPVTTNVIIMWSSYGLDCCGSLFNTVLCNTNKLPDLAQDWDADNRWRLTVINWSLHLSYSTGNMKMDKASMEVLVKGQRERADNSAMHR